MSIRSDIPSTIGISFVKKMCTEHVNQELFILDTRNVLNLCTASAIRADKPIADITTFLCRDIYDEPNALNIISKICTELSIILNQALTLFNLTHVDVNDDLLRDLTCNPLLVVCRVNNVHWCINDRVCKKLYDDCDAIYNHMILNVGRIMPLTTFYVKYTMGSKDAVKQLLSSYNFDIQDKGHDIIATSRSTNLPQTHIITYGEFVWIDPITNLIVVSWADKPMFKDLL